MIKESDVIEVFKTYEDPELGIDVWTLGLVYEYKIKGDSVTVLLTYTSPFCPYGPQMVEDLRKMILERGAKKVKITVTFDPPWKPSEELKEVLGM